MNYTEFYTQHCKNIKKRPVIATLLANVLEVSDDIAEKDLFYLFVVDHLFDIPFLTIEQLLPWILIQTGYLRTTYEQLQQDTLTYPVISIINYQHISVDGEKWLNVNTGVFIDTDELPKYIIHTSAINLCSIYNVFRELIW